jgi:hypothetical protein
VILHNAPSAIFLLYERSSVLEEGFTSRCQAYLSRIPMEQSNPKLSLQHLNPLGECRLREIEISSCTAEMTLVCDYQKCPDIS